MASSDKYTEKRDDPKEMNDFVASNVDAPPPAIHYEKEKMFKPAGTNKKRQQDHLRWVLEEAPEAEQNLLRQQFQQCSVRSIPELMATGFSVPGLYYAATRFNLLTPRKPSFYVLLFGGASMLSMIKTSTSCFKGTLAETERIYKKYHQHLGEGDATTPDSSMKGTTYERLRAENRARSGAAERGEISLEKDGKNLEFDKFGSGFPSEFGDSPSAFSLISGTPSKGSSGGGSEGVKRERDPFNLVPENDGTPPDASDKEGRFKSF